MSIRTRNHDKLIVGIDATNLRGGGGVTHLVELLQVIDPSKHEIASIVVWGGEQTLSKLATRDWLKRVTPQALNRGFLHRAWWQLKHLSNAAKDEGCDVLFVPGGVYAGRFRPVVTMSRNMLPFEWRELRRYGCSLMTLRLLFLRYIQSQTFCNADGLIFISSYAQKVVSDVVVKTKARVAMIPHGVDSRFLTCPRKQRAIADYTMTNPFRIVYVSIVDVYKHQWKVVEAVAALRKEGFPIVLDLFGPSYPRALKRLRDTINRADPDGEWANYRGAVVYDDLCQAYASADLGLFASSCENMPNILLETMASGLPVTCSDRGPMPEVLGSAGVYFDPENATDIANAVRQLVESLDLRVEKAAASYQRAKMFPWQKCADATFAFIRDIARTHRKI